MPHKHKETFQESQVLSKQVLIWRKKVDTTKKKTHGGTHGSSCICSRGWPSRPSMGGDALGPVNILCPSIGECLGQEAGVGGLGSRGKEEGDRGFSEGKLGKGTTFEM
jgi:hypothetical protein